MSPEKKVENQIKKALDNIKAYKLKNFATGQVGKGIPDIFALYQHQFYAIEVKRLQHGKPTPIQLAHLQAIANQGGISVVTSDPDFVDHYILNHQETNLKKIHLDPELLDKNNFNSPAQAKKLWDWTTKPHTLQILPNNNQ